ncbi:hypothetical protein [Streptomyces xanthii]|uniref:Uncharacterized protein n=1 Tax=Streptomyces xanthii TaxID=2768069 RepID=A0A7H1B7T0_9ACTN|nr:hypothetical protein [Streptomyces xanthii]QNS04785.1 hypothetical protein IAG42_14950 [Streptomyces xanthii]
MGGVVFSLKGDLFAGRGEIRSAEVCDSLGSRERASAALTKILPDRNAYQFEDSVRFCSGSDVPRYRSTCFVTGDGDQLLVAQSESLQNEPSNSWAKWVKGQAVNESSARSATAFDAGEKALASEGFAAVFMPCTFTGGKKREPLNTSVSVEVKPSARRADRGKLMELTKSAASFAHERAKCDRLAKLGRPATSGK